MGVPLNDVLKEYMSIVPEDELINRVNRFKSKLEADAAILFHPPDIYYFSGTKQEGFLVIPKDRDPVFLCVKHVERARAEIPFEVVAVKSTRRLAEAVLDVLGQVPKVLATEMDLIKVSVMDRFKKVFGDSVSFVDISHLIRSIKAVKSEWELEVMRKASQIVRSAYLAAIEHLNEGITEIELSAYAFLEMRRLGHESGEVMRGGRMEGFLGHILSGFSAAVPSYMNAPLNGIGLSPAMPAGPSFKHIKRGEPVVFDFFGTYMGYLVDMTRTMALSPLDEKFKYAYSILKDIHSFLRENLKSGANTLDIYNGVMDLVSKTRYKDNFMGYEGNRVAFIGHGVGTEIDEYPFIARGLEMKLESGMTVAVEPKFIFPGEGAVGLENTYLITDEGAVNITDADEELVEK